MRYGNPPMNREGKSKMSSSEPFTGAEPAKSDRSRGNFRWKLQERLFQEGELMFRHILSGDFGSRIGLILR